MTVRSRCPTAPSRRYLDVHHGSVLILWGKLFGTVELEGEPVRYGPTRTLGSADPRVIATHEWQDIARDISTAPTWADRFGFLLRGPGWASQRRACLITKA